MRAAECWLGISLLLPMGCSLSGLGDFDIPKCDDNEKCQPLNDYYGLSRAEDCRTYLCRSDGNGCELSMTDFDEDGFVSQSCQGQVPAGTELDCADADAEVFPGNDERCDGKDNDCDAIIDEETVPDTLVAMLTLPSAEPTAVGSNLYFGNAKGSPVSASDPDPGPVFACSANKRGVTEQLLLPDGDPPSARTLQFAYQRTQDTPGFEEPPAGQTCPTASAFLNCSFDDTVATRIDSAWVVAAISRTGCSKGQLRVGYRSADGSSSVGLRGPEQQSNLYLGVDVGDDDCTGASRVSGVAGVTRPSLSGQLGDARHPRQALLGVIADQFDRPTCGGEARDVEVLGVWLETLGQDLMWTNGTNNGIPQVLGRTAGGGRPVVQSVTADGSPKGYLVAYGAEAGGLALHRLPLFEDPPAYVRGQPESRPTDPLNLGSLEHLFNARELDHVALTQVGVEGDHLVLGLAWLEGCGTTDAAVVFARARYFWADHTFEADEPLTLANVPGLREAPSVLHAATGFVEQGFTRGERVADADSTGGFFVAWRDIGSANQLTVARVLDLDNELLDTLSFDEAPDTPGVLLFYSNDRSYFADYQAVAGEVHAGALQCGG